MNIDHDLIALWGAVLSTILALTKIWEMWSARRRIEVSYSFTSIPEEGNDIIIRNVSDKPFIITFWELLFCERKNFRWVPYRTEDPCGYAYDLCIQGHSSKTLKFRGPDHFDWGHKAMAGKRIYLRLHIAGKRKPVTHFVYEV